MSDTDLQYELMMEGRMNLMHLPPGAIAWLWDRPAKQVDAAEALASSANAYGNPVVDASLLKADKNILLIKCEGGECFRVYPDGGYSYEDSPMDMGGCVSVLQGQFSDDCPMDDLGHSMIPDDEMTMGDLGGDMPQDIVVMASAGNDEHLDDMSPRPGVAVPQGMTNLAGEPTMDEDSAGGLTGAASGAGMGTGNPTPMMLPDSFEDFSEARFARDCLEADDDALDYLAEAAGLKFD